MNTIDIIFYRLCDLNTIDILLYRLCALNTIDTKLCRLCDLNSIDIVVYRLCALNDTILYRLCFEYYRYNIDCVILIDAFMIFYAWANLAFLRCFWDTHRCFRSVPQDASDLEERWESSWPWK